VRDYIVRLEGRQAIGWGTITIQCEADALTHIIHERFYCNRRYAAATSLAVDVSRPGEQARPSRPRHTVSSMPRSLRAPHARLAWRLGGFVTNHYE